MSGPIANPIPKVILVGRPNVGKSSLYNALLGYRRTIVLDLPGTTLDEVREKVEWSGATLTLADTQGIFNEQDGPLLEAMVGKADIVLFVVDALAGLTPFDKWIGQLIQRARKPTLLICNKCDAGRAAHITEFAELGVANSVETSAAHRRNIDVIRNWVLARMGVTPVVPLPDLADPDSVEPEADKVEPLSLAIIGRPNAGKSTLMNRLAGEAVSKVSPIPHTTRDAVSFELQTPQGIIRLVDTAGMRRPRSQKAQLEIFSIGAATRAIYQSDVVCLAIACHEPITDQDMRLLNLVEREGRPTLVLLNFWDRLTHKERTSFVADSDFAGYLKNFRTLPVSGLTGLGCNQILPLVRTLYKHSNKRVKTSRLNKVVERIVSANPPPSRGKRNFNILYASQVRTDPPTFVFFMNRKEALPESYQKYLVNSLRDSLHFRGQPIRLFFRGEGGR